MIDKRQPDWNPKAEEVQENQLAVYDTMREQCPVAWSEAWGWSIFRHEDVTRVLLDHDTFSNVVSKNLSVPNGMDPPEHTLYRRIIESYFTPERMVLFEPICREIAGDLVRRVLKGGKVEIMGAFALPFAARVQCAFLGWPVDQHERLIQWVQRNHTATFAEDRQTMSELAIEFENFVSEMLASRGNQIATSQNDHTAALMHEKVWDRRLSNEEISSILRNWTVGEIGTISAAVGIVLHFLARHTSVQQQLRDKPSQISVAIDEILRIHGPLVSNRRVATRPVEIGGRNIEAGDRITLIWIAANRDGRVFENPTAFRLDRDPAKNLLYGAGIHVCPGVPLARMELRVVMEGILEHTEVISLMPDNPPTNAIYPASGFSILPLSIRAART